MSVNKPKLHKCFLRAFKTEQSQIILLYLYTKDTCSVILSDTVLFFKFVTFSKTEKHLFRNCYNCQLFARYKTFLISFHIPKNRYTLTSSLVILTLLADWLFLNQLLLFKVDKLLFLNSNLISSNLQVKQFESEININIIVSCV